MSDAGKLHLAKTYQPKEQYLSLQEDSLRDPESFWAKIAGQLVWHRKWDKVLKWDPPFARWFVGGTLNASENAVDRHVKSWRKNKAAYLWEGESGELRSITYRELYREVNKFASVLQNLGLRQGDAVAIYMPLVPEFPITMLACARLGLPFTVVFSGFSANALAERIQDCEAKIVVTADGGYRRGKILELKTVVDDAVKESPSVRHVVVFRRTGHVVPMTEGRDYWWHDLMAKTSSYVAPVPVESTHLLYILYTSGTTGKPKGVAHGTGGYLAFAYATQEWVFDAKDDDVYWCTADIGWVTGHTYVVFAPLMHGLTSVMYEGALDYPGPDRWWEIVEHYGVTILYTAPTAIRSLMRHGDDLPRQHDLESLRLLGTVGEPINPTAWQWYFDVIGQGRCPIVDTWWQTETGGIMISPSPRLGLVLLKAGSATFPMPGIEADVVDEKGKPLAPGEKGFLVIKKPWPGMLMTLYKDPERYLQVYWTRFPGFYYPGDYALRDADGYFWLLGRADEVIKVAGHRLGTKEVEDALVSHPSVAEAAVAGRPDPVKGESIVAFVTLRKAADPSKNLSEELKQHVRKMIGPIATPESIYFAQHLPKTRSGKIMRRVIKAVAAGGPIGDLSTLEDGASVDEVRQAIEALQMAEKTAKSS
ncbi:MAG: acetate--CoA ligase [Crenarchaeota archaeon 13_1_40CM_3_52_10]|nr:MAG: acetate--CoA ligase [Crenarchaeota archaeon 13_1_40CM_3_52_10]